jgi:hypothetical protein
MSDVTSLTRADMTRKFNKWITIDFFKPEKIFLGNIKIMNEEKQRVMCNKYFIFSVNNDRMITFDMNNIFPSLIQR